MQPTRSYTYNGATITLRPPTVRDRLMAEVVYERLVTTFDEPTPMWPLKEFARFVTSIDSVDGELAFQPPAATASADELRAAYDAFMDTPGGFYDHWKREYDLVTTPPNA